MPVVRYDEMNLQKIAPEGSRGVSKAVVISKNEGWKDNTMRVFRLEPGGHSPRHSHDWEHINYVISGRGKLRLGEQIFELAEKDFAFVPENTEHQFQNPFDEPFEFICIVPNRGEY